MRIETSWTVPTIAIPQFADFIADDNTPCDTLEDLLARKAAGETGLDAAISKASRECNAYNAGDDALPRRGGRAVDPDAEPTKPTKAEPAEPPVKPVKTPAGGKRATAPGALDF